MNKNKKRKEQATTSQVLCVECNEDVLSDAEDSIQCATCKSWTHEYCTGLSKRQFGQMAVKGVIYQCKNCKLDAGGSEKRRNMENITLTNSQYNNIMEKLNELMSIKTTVKDLADSVTYVSAQHDDIISQMKTLQGEIKNLKKENEKIRAELDSVKKSVNILDGQQIKKQCFVKVNKNLITDNVKKSVAEIMNTVGCGLREDDIEFAAIQSKLSHNQSQVVKVGFQTFNTKMIVMKNKRNLREVEKYKDVAVYDVLTKDVLNLFNHAKELKKIGFHSVYTVGTRVLARKTESGNAELMRSKNHVDKLLGDAVRGESSNRVLLNQEQSVSRSNPVCTRRSFRNSETQGDEPEEEGE